MSAAASPLLRLDGAGACATVEQALQHDCGFLPLESHRCTRVCYDTFDRRLYKAGLILEADERGEGVALSLRRLGTCEVQASAQAPAAPRFPADLAESHLRERLARLTKLRALLPWVAMDVEAVPLRLEDGIGKTVARASVERATLNGGRGGTLHPVLRLHALRGYEDALGGALAALSGVPGCEQDPEDPFVEALAGAGTRWPLAYSNRSAIVLAPQQAAGSALGAVLDAYHRNMRLNEAGVLEDLDSEFLHDFRTSMRRSRSSLQCVRKVMPRDHAGAFKEDFRWLSRTTSGQRDLDVFLLDFDAHVEVLPEGLEDAARALRGYLAARRAGEHEHVVAELRSPRYEDFTGRWRGTIDGLKSGRLLGPRARAPARDVARDSIGRLYKRVRRQGRAMGRDAAITPLHELRKDCKKLRYVIEAFASLYDAEDVEHAIGVLKKLQDNLGAICDLAVQGRMLADWRADVERGGGAREQAALPAIGHLERHCREMLDEPRRRFERTFARFDSKKSRKRMLRLAEPA